MSLLFSPPILLSLISFIISIAIFSGGKFTWHLSTFFWIALPIYYIFVAGFLSNGVNLLSILAVFVTLVNTAFIIYFQSKHVKNYFGASAKVQLDTGL
ncbi:MAG: hypothetical protein JSV35_05070 [Candidatus Bathyarchaeota archaeon]|nr:MAG: hypothetical protein JSV35_05070 [Candidatus Bathyarchaeota archaeon]